MSADLSASGVTQMASASYWIRNILFVSLAAALSVGPIGLLTESAEAADLEVKEPASIRNIRPNDDASREVLSDEQMKRAVPLPMPDLTPGDLKRMGFRNVQRKRLPLDGDVPEPPFDPSDLFRPRPVENPGTRRPFRDVGKLFFKTNSGEISHCTAEFVGSRRVLLTAGHCVADMETGEPFSNFTFVQAYDSGNYTKKIGVECLAIYDEYSEPFYTIAFDYAFLYADSESASGNLGFRTGAPFSSISAVGYPINFDAAERMYLDSGTRRFFGIMPGIVAMTGNEMENGSSGGAWIGALREQPGGKSNMVVGLNAYMFGWVFGPLFDETTDRLLQHVKNRACGS